MIKVSIIRCAECNLPMECLANIKILSNGSIAHSLNTKSITTKSLSGIYECPKCKKRVDLQIKEG